MNTIKLEVDDEYILGCDNSCLICLQSVTQVNNEKLTNPLNFLFNYLKLKDEVKSVVCEECGRYLAKFANLCNILEKAKLEIDYLLEFLQSKILNSNKSSAQESGFSVRDLIMKRCSTQIKSKAQVILQRLDSNPTMKPSFDDLILSDGDLDESPATPIIEDIRTIKTEAITQSPKTPRRKYIPQKATCPTCSKTFYSKQKLQIHINSVHLRIKPFKCPTCPKEFSRNEELRSHINIIHLQIYSHTCDICLKSFSTLQNLRVHKATHKHSLVPPPRRFSCEKCGNSFANMASLKSHQRRVHSEKSFECGICKKIFSNSSRLNRHVSSIHDKRRHHCRVPNCDRNYASNWSLMAHCRMEHPDFIEADKPNYYSDKFKEINKNGSSYLECALCRGHFKTDESVKKHLIGVHGCVEFKCWECGYGTRCKDRFNDHIKQHENHQLLEKNAQITTDPILEVETGEIYANNDS